MLSLVFGSVPTSVSDVSHRLFVFDAEPFSNFVNAIGGENGLRFTQNKFNGRVRRIRAQLCLVNYSEKRIQFPFNYGPCNARSQTTVQRN